MIVGILLAPVLAISAWAQSNGAPRPPAVGELMRALPKDAPPIAAILAIQPQEPAGPSDVLRNYEQGMALVAQRTFLGLAQIAEATRQGQIGREQAEHFSYAAYQSGMMQFQLLSTLHQILEIDIAKAAQQSDAAQSIESRDSFPGTARPDPAGASRESNAPVPASVPMTQ